MVQTRKALQNETGYMPHTNITSYQEEPRKKTSSNASCFCGKNKQLFNTLFSDSFCENSNAISGSVCFCCRNVKKQ